MERINLEKITRAEKVELLKDIVSGELVVIDGRVFSKDEGVVLTEKDGKLFHDTKCTDECTIEQREHFKAVLILPFNER